MCCRCVDADSILHTLEDRVLSAEAALAEATRHQFQLQIQAAEDSIQRELQEVDSALQLKLMQVWDWVGCAVLLAGR